MTGIDNEMLNTPQKVERFLATVVFPDIGAPEVPFGSDRNKDSAEGGGAEEVAIEDAMSPGKAGKKKKKKKSKKKKSKKGGKSTKKKKK